MCAKRSYMRYAEADLGIIEFPVLLRFPYNEVNAAINFCCYFYGGEAHIHDFSNRGVAEFFVVIKILIRRGS